MTTNQPTGAFNPKWNAMCGPSGNPSALPKKNAEPPPQTTQQPTETPTPRTVAKAYSVFTDFGEHIRVVNYEDVQLIERELTAAKAEIARLRQAGDKMNKIVLGLKNSVWISLSPTCMDLVNESIAAWEALKNEI